jgi:hypothetical protein
MSNNGRAFPVLSLVYNLFAIPYNFFIGFLVGVAAPAAVIAAMVYGIRFLTGKMPFPSLQQDAEEEERRLSIELVAPEVIGDLFASERERIMDELASLRAEFKAMRQEFAAEEAAEAPAEESQGA